MCPELLSGSFGREDFTNYKWADMYSFGLVIWEILSRTELYDGYKPDEYRVPYEEFAPASTDPSISDMRRIVCEGKNRPQVPDFTGLTIFTFGNSNNATNYTFSSPRGG